MKKLTKEQKRAMIATGIGVGIGIIGTIIGVKCIANHKYHSAWGIKINADDGIKTVADDDVADLVSKHSRFIDRINTRKATVIHMTCADILGGIKKAPEKKNWKFKFKGDDFELK